MDTVTYPNTKVIQFINENMIPLRIASDVRPFSSDFNIKWTPVLITLDSKRKEHHRTIGLLPPEELIPSLLLGMGKFYFDTEQFDKAVEVFDKLLEEYPESGSAPEAIYMSGVCRYKITKNTDPLKSAYEKLQDEYPSSEWTKRAYPYRLL